MQVTKSLSCLAIEAVCFYGMPDSLHSRKCMVTVGLAPCRAVETEEEIATDEIVVPYDFVEVQDGVWHLELMEHLLHVFVGKKKIESADILYV